MRKHLNCWLPAPTAKAERAAAGAEAELPSACPRHHHTDRRLTGPAASYGYRKESWELPSSWHPVLLHCYFM